MKAIDGGRAEAIDRDRAVDHLVRVNVRLWVSLGLHLALTLTLTLTLTLNHLVCIFCWSRIFSWGSNAASHFACDRLAIT